ncbi:MAG TPA: hypothetical protein VFT98_02525 [Myxococcota bacterium]|nr:hypothetical protein [Myxococcota bacterium]
MNAAPFVAGCALALALGGAARADSAAAGSPPAAETTPASLAVARDFPAPDLLHAQRVAIATLQDLGFALESADAERGVLIASLLDTHPLRLAVSITAKDDTTISASVTTDWAGASLASPEPVAAFFSAYEAALNPPPELD